MAEIVGILAAGILFAVFALVTRERRRCGGSGGCGAGACGGCSTNQTESNDEPR